MNTYDLKIELLGYWHAGSGHGAKADVDAHVLSDNNGFPYLPGRTVKGLLRDALCDMGAEATANELFGKPAPQGENTGSIPGKIAVDDARMPADERSWIDNDRDADGLKAQLFDSVASTAIEKNGLATEKSLRLIEVALPMILQGSITYLGNAETESADLALLGEACGLIRTLGSHRHRGLGRCRWTLKPSTR
jgi:CRISPR/Cas system CSM-associated protein Csm3 (group 7 of RAMP superfamily)